MKTVGVRPTIGGMFVEEILKRQSGVITRQQALAEGLSNSAITRTTKAGTWEPVLPRVFVASSYELTDQARTRAVALWAGERATVSGLAAAWRHGADPQRAERHRSHGAGSATPSVPPRDTSASP